MNCPICGKPGYCGATLFECETPGCQNYKAPKPQASPYDRTYNCFGGVDIKILHNAIDNALGKLQKRNVVEMTDTGHWMPSDYMSSRGLNDCESWQVTMATLEQDKVDTFIMNCPDDTCVPIGSYDLMTLRYILESKLGKF